MNAISNVYLIIFLPLISALLCQIFGKKILPFWIAISSIIILLFLSFVALPDVLVYEKITNDFELSPLSIALEFRLDVLGITFLSLIIFLKAVILFYYRQDIENTLDESLHKVFYSVYLLHLFGLIGIFTANNLLNLFFFFEIYGFAFFAILSISRNLKIAELSFRHFCLNATASLIILLCFFAIYLCFGEINFSQINEALAIASRSNDGFLSLVFLLLAVAFVIKFFPFWLYFDNLKSTNPISNFITIDSLFIKTNVGIFVALKFIYFFFGSNIFFQRFEWAPLAIFIALILIFYSTIKLYQQTHLKTIATYLCLNNLGFIIACAALQTIESLQAVFFYIINFSLVNLLIFIFATFLKRHFKTSSISTLFVVRQNHFSLVLPFKLLILCIAAFPLSSLFFANWYTAYASFNLNFSAFLLVALIISNFVQVNLAIKLITVFLSKPNKNHNQAITLEASNYSFYLASFWFLIAVIYILCLASSLMNSLALRFASFLLSNSI